MNNLKLDNFDSAVASGKVLVDFWAPWCSPCRMLSPIVEQLAESEPSLKVYKVNVDEEPELSKRFGIMSIPTLLLFKDGKLADKSVGFMDLESLKEFII